MFDSWLLSVHHKLSDNMAEQQLASPTAHQPAKSSTTSDFYNHRPRTPICRWRSRASSNPPQVTQLTGGSTRMWTQLSNHRALPHKQLSKVALWRTKMVMKSLRYTLRREGQEGPQGSYISIYHKIKLQSGHLFLQNSLSYSVLLCFFFFWWPHNENLIQWWWTWSLCCLAMSWKLWWVGWAPRFQRQQIVRISASKRSPTKHI